MSGGLVLSDVVGERIAELRRALGWSQQALADACRPLGLDVTAPVIANIEGGRRGESGRRRREVTVDELVVIATALGVPPVSLVFPVGFRERSETLGGRLNDPMEGAQWFSGERPPSGLLQELAEQMMAGEQDARERFLTESARLDRGLLPLHLYRRHVQLVAEWSRSPGEGVAVAVTGMRPRDEIESELARLRQRMRREGLTVLPVLPAELSKVDDLAHRGWAQSDV